MLQNPNLQPLAGVIGRWSLLGSHPLLPDRNLRGEATFDWLESGAFLIWRTRMEDQEIPDGVAIFGTDGDADDNSMIYFDVRGVSREYRWSFDGGVWRWWRTSPDLSQRMTLTISADGQTIESSGEMSRAGAAWEPDLHLTYTRAA